MKIAKRASMMCAIVAVARKLAAILQFGRRRHGKSAAEDRLTAPNLVAAGEDS